MLKLIATLELPAMPSWAIAVISPKQPSVRNGRRLKRVLQRCSTMPPAMLPAASTLVNSPRSRGSGPST